jgi:TonB family protein
MLASVLAAWLSAVPTAPVTMAPPTVLPAPAAPAVEWLELAAPAPLDAARRIHREHLAAVSAARALRTAGQGPGHEQAIPLPLADGPDRGEWTFFFVNGVDEAPAGAWRLEMPAAAPYRVRATAYCEPTHCPALVRRLRALPAPVVRGNLELYLEWQAVVRAEPCEAALPPRMPYPRYPERALGNDIEGRVLVQMFHNACGDVRDVSLVESSGNAALDQAALSTLGRWRITPRRPGQAGFVRQSVRFRIEDEIAPEATPRAP